MNAKGRATMLDANLQGFQGTYEKAGAFDNIPMKPTAANAKQGQRFTVEQAQPDQSYNPFDGIGHASVNGQDAIMNSRKERFHVELATPGDDTPVGEGAFDHAMTGGGGPSKAFQLDRPGGADRSAAWITSKDGVNMPEVQPGEGAFEAALASNKPSSNF